MLDLVVIDGQARGIVTRDLVTGKIESHLGRRRGARHRRLRQRLLPLHQRQGLERHGDLARAQARRAVRQSVLHADPSRPAFRSRGEYQSKLTLMSESLRNDGRVWVPKKKGDKRPPRPDSRSRARLLPGAQVSELRQPGAARHRLAQRQGGLRRRPRRGRDRPRRLSRFRATPSSGWASSVIEERYGNLFEMYERITGEDPYKVPMRIYPAIHYTMGGLWVDYNLMSTIPGPVRDRRSELLRSRRQPAGRQRADAGSGRRLLRPAVHDRRLPRLQQAREGRRDRIRQFARRKRERRQRRSSGCSRSRASARWIRSIASSARSCGTTAAWRATAEGLQNGARADSASCARSSGANVQRARAAGEELNQSLEKAGRVADFFELAELMCLDALRAQRILRRPFPRGVPDAGRRSAARRRALLVCRGLGVTRRRQLRRCCTRSR